jgi:hypothetical protein
MEMDTESETSKTPALAAFAFSFSFPLHLLVPALTIGTAAFALLTFAAPQPVFAVKVWGGPTEYPGQQTVRLVCHRDETGVVDTVALQDVHVRIGETEATVACSEGGSVEVPVRLAGGGKALVKVTQGKRVLAEGTAFVTGEAWRARSVRRSSRVERATFRGLKARGFVSGGALVLGKDNRLYFQVTEGPPGFRCGPSARPASAPAQALPQAREQGQGQAQAPLFDVSGEGADVTAPEGCGPDGFVVGVRPTFVTASVRLRSHEAPTEVFWEAQIPVVTAPLIEPPAITLDEHHTLRTKVRSLGLVAGFHARVEDERGRRVARFFPAQKDARGGSWADLELDLRGVLAEEPWVPPADGNSLNRAAFLVVSTDESGGTSSASVAVGLALPYKDRSIDHHAVAMAEPTADVLLGPTLLWVDGLTPAAKREALRTNDARRRVMLLVFAGAVLEGLLVFRRARRSASQFRAHLAAAEDHEAQSPAEEGLDLRAVEDKSRLSSAFLAIAVIVFGFAILAVVVASRLG